ncbi:hypothetical protein PIIN_10120 [Serendipita indica DSM 11827]|uniref:Integral membrane protein n=1 Tax=Serendipita indica (strain DSM 11827) TaxID=1109443 RepID=G4TXS7_SERID|nr:hypothetical protein PIIN_10120 [Serendipita indica DSM 11827]
MKPRTSLLSILPFIGGAMARGSRTWYAPPEIQAGTVFEFIWSVVLFGLFVTILRRLHLVPPGRYARAPYILLSIVAGASSISHLVSGVLFVATRVEHGLQFNVMHGLSAFGICLAHIDLAFGPAVCLWLIHLRGSLAPTVEAKPLHLWVSQSWKRILDWLLVAVTFILAISMTVIINIVWMEYGAGHLRGDQVTHFLIVNRNLNFAVVAFGLLLSIDIAVSLISLKVTQRRVHFIDPLTTRLVVAVLPFVVLRFIESLVLTIYPESYAMRYTDYDVLILLTIILGGLCTVGFIGGVASTMTIPNVLWVSGANGSTSALPIVQGARYPHE